jgi:hypothetical protein
VALFAVSSNAGAHIPITTEVTWNGEVVRIFREHCIGCHRRGGTAFSLERFAEARPWAKAIRDEVLERRMPPWPAVQGVSDIANARSLAPRLIELIVAWAEGGAPEGEPAELPRASTRQERLRAAALFEPGARLPLAIDEISVGGDRLVELELVSRAGSVWLGSYAPPGERIRLPFAIALGKGARLAGGRARLRPAPGPGRPLVSAVISGTEPIVEGAQVLAVEPHAPPGTNVEVRLVDDAGARETLVWIPRFIPTQRFTYWMRAPKPAGPRAQLEVTPPGTVHVLMALPARESAPPADAR